MPTAGADDTSQTGLAVAPTGEVTPVCDGPNPCNPGIDGLSFLADG
jgi:hypothetical protein